jgi:hypothetical protein
VDSQKIGIPTPLLPAVRAGKAVFVAVLLPFFPFFLCSKHSDNNQISHAARGYHIQIFTMFGRLEQVLEIDLLPKNVPLSDPRLQPFEGLYAKSHNL